MLTRLADVQKTPEEVDHASQRPTSYQDLILPRENTAVSPELVLVDPGIADRARDDLPAPPDTLSALLLPPSDDVIPAARDRPRRRPFRFTVRALLLVALAVGGFFVGSRAVDEPATALPSTLNELQQGVVLSQRTTGEPVASESTPKPEPAPTAPRRRATAIPAAGRRFAWPPVTRASGYHVELFKGSTLVFRADTRMPQIVMPNRWRLGGKTHRLAPGEYRWYVWPLVRGHRVARAIVQAKLVVRPIR